MAHVKTAISMQKSLFEQAEALARALKVSRSRLVVLALEDFIRRQQNQQLLHEIDTAYAHEDDLAEKTLPRKMRRSHRRLVDGEW